MTDAELRDIERMVAQDCLPNRPERTVLGLVAEVRRLRDALAAERESCARAIEFAWEVADLDPETCKELAANLRGQR